MLHLQNKLLPHRTHPTENSQKAWRTSLIRHNLCSGASFSSPKRGNFLQIKTFSAPCFPFPRVLNLHLINTNFLVHSRYEQAVEDPFHISKACLEPTSVKDGKNSITSVYIEVDDEEFLLCNLSDKVLNESLDLNFNTGDKLVFKTSVSILIVVPNVRIR